MQHVSTHQVLKTLPLTVDVNKKYQAAEKMLKMYEGDMVAMWMSQQVWEADVCLQRHLICVCPEQQKLKTNLHPTIRLLIREADLMIKMDLQIPMVALTLYSKQDHFTLVQDTLQVHRN